MLVALGLAVFFCLWHRATATLLSGERAIGFQVALEQSED